MDDFYGRDPTMPRAPAFTHLDQIAEKGRVKRLRQERLLQGGLMPSPKAPTTRRTSGGRNGRSS